MSEIVDSKMHMFLMGDASFESSPFKIQGDKYASAPEIAKHSELLSIYNTLFLETGT